VGQLLSLNVKDILKEMSSQLQSDYQKKENFTRSQIRGIQKVRNCNHVSGAKNHCTDKTVYGGAW
jgi:hypothetical protein